VYKIGDIIEYESLTGQKTGVVEKITVKENSIVYLLKVKKGYVIQSKEKGE